jgi:hypothetical protein
MAAAKIFSDYRDAPEQADEQQDRRPDRAGLNGDSSGYSVSPVRNGAPPVTGSYAPK